MSDCLQCKVYERFISAILEILHKMAYDAAIEAEDVAEVMRSVEAIKTLDELRS